MIRLLEMNIGATSLLWHWGFHGKEARKDGEEWLLVLLACLQGEIFQNVCAQYGYKETVNATSSNAVLIALLFSYSDAEPWHNI